MSINTSHHADALAAYGLNLSGETVAIIGVGGIGLETARLCAAAGASLRLVDAAALPADAMTGLHGAGQHESMQADLSRPSEQCRVVEFIRDAAAVVITAAICPDDTTRDAGSAQWHETFSKVFQVNLEAGMNISMQMLEHMKERQVPGRIVLLGSLGARTGGLLSGAQYAASKGAVHTFVRWLAARAAPMGINVNGVAPGVTDTPMIEGRRFDVSRIPAGRPARPVEIARVVAFLASPACSYVNGQILDVNGGAWGG